MRAPRLAALVVVALLIGAGCSRAAAGQEAPRAAGAPARAAAQAGAPKAAPPAGSANLPDRVSSLEKQSVVLSEDLGKTRLDQRMQLDELGKRQAEAIAKLNKQLADTQEQLAAEHEKQSKRNRNLWIAVGVLALGLMAAS